MAKHSNTQTVLIVHDAPAILPERLRALSCQPCDVLTAENVEEALATLTDRQVDVVIAAEPTQPQSSDAQQLQSRLNAQTRQLETCRKELQIARTKAEQVCESQSVFLSNMSHEIRTPMNIILGFSRLLLREDLGEEHRESLGFITSAGESLLDLLNDLLDFSNLESGELTIDHEVFSLDNILPELRAVGQGLVGDKNIRVAIELSDKIPAQLRGDGSRIQHILTNLLSNAVKFTSEGEVKIRARRTEESQRSITVRFEVIDTGIGIPLERREQIFNSFTQADGSSTRKYGGTGLGLTISQRLVHLMDGEIGVESELGQGSTFWFTLAFEKADCVKSRKPASERKSDPETAPPETAPPETTPPETSPFNLALASRLAARVLVVDDESLDRRLVRRLLQDLHCRVDEAESGEAALRKTKEHTYDVIFMDVQLPDIDGLEVTKFIRSDDQSPNQAAKIVAITAHALEGDRKRCLLAGMDDFLSKPIRARALRTVVQRFIPTRVSPAAGENSEPANANAIHGASLVHAGDSEGLESYQTAEQAAAMLGRLREALKNEELAVVEKNAHQLRSLAVQLNEERLDLDAFRVELAARRSDLKATTAALNTLLKNANTLAFPVYASETCD